MWYIIGLGTVLGMYLLISGLCYSKYKKAYCFNPLKWYNVIQGYFYMWLMPPHVLEQIYIRLNEVKCQPCIENGACLYCNCDTIPKMYSLREIDAYQNEDGFTNPRWGKIIRNKKKYEEYRNNYPIKINIQQ